MRKTRHSTVLSNSQTTDGFDNTGNDFGNEAGCNSSRDHEDGEDVPEAEQDVWDALREEFYEHIEQLPLSLRRSLSLIGEQDNEVQGYQTELLPIIRTYVKLRQSGALDPKEPNASSKEDGTENPPTAAATGISNGLIEEDHDPTTGLNVIDKTFLLGVVTPNGKRNSEPRSDRRRRLPPTPGRSQALRETDASVPKSVPFPSREKPETSNELLPRISFLMSEILRASEEKVGLASAAYDTVDRHIRALDVAIESLGGSIPETGEEKPTMATSFRKGTGGTGVDSVADGEEQTIIAQLTIEEQRTTPRTRKTKKRDAHSTTGKEPEVDPNEPRYCYCNQVSYGEMIACDNRDCAREWFHLDCVELAAPPKGKWYCKDCEEAIQRIKRRRVH